MRNLTQCLARVVYQLDLDNLPLKVLSEEGHRPRRETMGSTSEWIRKKSFSAYLPPPLSFSSSSSLNSSLVGGVKSGGRGMNSSRVLAKASTVELSSSQRGGGSPLSVPEKNEKRRASSPAMPGSRRNMEHSQPSSVPVTKRELVKSDDKNLTILEDQEEEEEEGIPFASSQIELETINEEGGVTIINHHASPEPHPSPQPPEVSVNSPTGSKYVPLITEPRLPNDSIVISNEDVSTSDGGGGVEEEESLEGGNNITNNTDNTSLKGKRYL